MNRKLIVLAVLVLAACSPQKFRSSINDVGQAAVPITPGTSSELAAKTFSLTTTPVSFSQDVLAQNNTSISFQVPLPDGTFSNNLKASDIHLVENGVSIPDFKLTSSSQNTDQTVDIVLALDVTCSMVPTIESAKTNLINFVRNARLNNYHTRMCLSTFGDYTVQKCTQFTDNDPSNPATMTQVNQLISDISKLKALCGAQDPGGNDLNENPMRALIDASIAPWNPSSQRFLILVTDDGFLYSPDNQGDVGTLAPYYADVLTAIQTSQMNVFMVGPNRPGYKLPFKGNPSVVTASNGEFFLFADLVDKKISLDTVLNRILRRVQTTYTASYTADEVPGLDPSLPLSLRDVRVSLNAGVPGQVVAKGAQSNLPTGRANYKKTWRLSEKKIRAETLQVKVNGQPVSTGYVLTNTDLTFAAAPAPGTKIEVVFQFDSLKDALQTDSILIAKVENLDTLQFSLNGIAAPKTDFVFTQNLDGDWVVTLGERVLSETDPYQIRMRRSLVVRIVKP